MCGCSLIVEAASYVSNSPEHNEDISSGLVLVEPFRRSEAAKVKLFCDGETSRFSNLQGPPAAKREHLRGGDESQGPVGRETREWRAWQGLRLGVG